ncbi:hypothetical protein JCM19232_811 [Vibrio ishigakensis]|uniref:Lipoprotein n=1 Tax=Vibrio ishigakensis TaxID=1481914 RepID=A0A0B8PBC1_9VIBR|nr:hypothetical protein JCM19232_811 [Vibrio ishigakensis]
MKASKTAIAVAISSVFLFGCDFDVGSENNDTTQPPEVTPPPSEVYSIENIYWDVQGGATALTTSGTSPYFFSNDEKGTRALNIYSEDTLNGGYTFKDYAYIATEEGKVAYDDKQCTYTVTDKALDMVCEQGGIETNYTGVEIEDQSVIDELENATDGKAATVAAVNAAISAAQDGDVIGLSSSGIFDSGVIELNKAVTLDGSSLAMITGDACIDITAPGAAVKNITFKNDNLAGCFGRESAGTSDNEAGAIVIGKIGKDQDPVLLENLTFDANLITEDDIGPKKASWLFSRGYFTLTDSEFLGLSGSFQNNAIRLNCSSDNGRFGSKIINNEFTINSGGSDVGGIKVGDSSGAVIKPSDDNLNCNVTIEGNTFNGYKTLLSADNTSDNRQTAIYAQPAAVNTASGKENILN